MFAFDSQYTLLGLGLVALGFQGQTWRVVECLHSMHSPRVHAGLIRMDLVLQFVLSCVYCQILHLDKAASQANTVDDAKELAGWGRTPFPP